MEFFARVDAKKLETQLQYDYFAAYVDFYADKPTGLADARKLAAKYGDYPVDRWRKLFVNVRTQLDEIDGKTPTTMADKEDRTQVQTALAGNEPSMDLKLDGAKATLHFQNLAEVRVNYYRMDIELMFSRNPFVAGSEAGSQFASQFAYVQPNKTDTIKLPADGKEPTLNFDLPKELTSGNLFVEAIGGPVRKSAVYFANALTVQVTENYGQLTIAKASTNKPMAKVYVKVYARMKDGPVAFYKDGYTDLRGRFDYTSLNTDELDRVDRFSILVLSDTDGAVIREASPPKR
jgi:hypothetical protein